MNNQQNQNEAACGVSPLTAERTKLIGISADEVSNTFDAFAEVARKVDMPTLEEIAQFRMDLMRNEYGIARFLEPVWWRWLWMSWCLTPKVMGRPQRTEQGK